MRIAHFTSLKPVCPCCRTNQNSGAPLRLATIARQRHDTILEGTLDCSNPHCGVSYPIIDGIPIIVPDLAKYVSESIYAITARTDLSERVDALLGTAAGPGANYNINRHYLSTYGWDHYGDFVSAEVLAHEQRNAPPGSVVACLSAGLNLFTHEMTGPVLDIGCAVGRSSFELAAQSNDLILGIDLNFSGLRLAQRVLQEGQVSYPLKQLGIIYHQQNYAVDVAHQERVDFWACDALALPFAKGTFSFVNALNVIDTVHAPIDFLISMNEALRAGGQALLATPYDWSLPVPITNWLGGRARFDVHSGDSVSTLRSLLDGSTSNVALQSLRLINEIEHHPWHVRVHSRRTAAYDTHILACKKTAQKDTENPSTFKS